MKLLTTLIILTLLLVVGGCDDYMLSDYTCEEVEYAILTNGCIMTSNNVFSGRCFDDSALAYYLENECKPK